MTNKYLKSGKIYQLEDLSNGNLYIGSTIERLSTRLAKHRYNYNMYVQGNGCYCSSYKILENNNYQISLLEKYICDSRDDIIEREGIYVNNYIKDNKIVINKNMPGRKQDKQYFRDYYQRNKERLREMRISLRYNNLI